MSSAQRNFMDTLIFERKRLGLTLQMLSQKSQVSSSLISKIENGQVNPTIEVASRIAMGLQNTLASMLSNEQTDEVEVLPADQQVILRNEADTHIRRFSSPIDRQNCVEIYQETLFKGASIDFSHYWAAEVFMLILSGSLSIETDGSLSHTLTAGDSIYFRENQMRNLTLNSTQTCEFTSVLHHKDTH